MLEALDTKQLIFVTGKGGVGKSTCTAALAEALSQRGRKVLVVETDAFSAMSTILGVEGEEGKFVEIHEGLTAINLQSYECLVNTLTRYLPSRRIVKAVTQNRVAKSFFQSAPSVNEFVLLDQILSFVEDGDAKYDHVVVDLPASGHALTFLNVPKTLSAMMRNVGPIAKRAWDVAARIENPKKTAVVAVCLPEEMPVQETIELSENLDETLGRGLNIALVNMVHPRPFPSTMDDAFENAGRLHETDKDPTEVLSSGRDGVARILAGNALALSWYRRDRHYLQKLHDNLAAEIVALPMVYKVEEREIVNRIAQFLNASDSQIEEMAS